MTSKRLLSFKMLGYYLYSKVSPAVLRAGMTCVQVRFVNDLELDGTKSLLNT
jgi:hypothetical protein